MNVCTFFLQAMQLLPPVVTQTINRATIDSLKSLEKAIKEDEELEGRLDKLKEVLKEEPRGDKTIEDVINGKVD
jgi:hypothetical protein